MYYIHALFWILLTLLPVSVSGDGDTREMQRALHLLFPLVALFFLPIGIHQRKFDASLISITLFVLSVVAYYATISLFFDSEFLLSDIVDIFRPLVYFFYFMVPVIFVLDERGVSRVFNLMLLLLIVQIVFSSFVYIPSLWEVINHYKGRTSDDDIIFHFYRWSGSFGYPSDFSFYLSFFIYYYFAIYINTCKRIYLLYFSLLFAPLLLTMSRGGIATVVLMIFIALLHKKKFSAVAAISTISAIIFINGFWILGSDNKYFNYSYIESLISEGIDADTAKHRVLELTYALDVASSKFPFGEGANRLEIEKNIPVIESHYGHHLIKWGFLGLMIYALFVVYILRLCMRIMKRDISVMQSSFVYAYMMLTISVFLIFGFSSAVTDRLKCLPFYYLLTGYVYMMFVSTKYNTSFNNNK